MRSVTVGVAQATPALFDCEATVQRVVEWISRAAEAGCELLLFPESFIPVYPRGLRYDAVVGRRSDESRRQWLDYWQQSVTADDPRLAPVQDAIRRAGLYVALGVTERELRGGSLYCSLFYYDRQGQLLGRHRKLKPTGLERYLWGEGDPAGIRSYATDLGEVGGLICWENYMPLARLSQYQQGVEIYLAPTADARASWQSTLQHIALEGRCYVLAANQYVRKQDYPDRYQAQLAEEPEVMSPGGSAIYSPLGEMLAGPLWQEEGLLTATLDPDVLAMSKLDFDAVGHYARWEVWDFGEKENDRNSPV